MRILIIDDNDDLRTLLAHHIREQWPEVEIEQFDPLEHDIPGADYPLGSYDVMILDYMLGRGDGLQWLQQFKKRADCPKVLFLTGAGNEIIAVRAMKEPSSAWPAIACWSASTCRFRSPMPLCGRGAPPRK